MTGAAKSDPMVLTLTPFGDALGVVLPPEILTELAVGPGDKLLLSRSPDGYRITRSTPEFERQMSLARDTMERRHAVLRELAK